MDPGKRSAFLATTYRADLPEGPLDIRIHQRHDRLDALLEDRGQEGWAFLTAWNPGSKDLPRAENEARNADLRRRLQERGLPHYPGRGIPEAGPWTPEESFLVLGLGQEEAVALGRDFEQLAIVVGRRGGQAELVDCVPHDPTPSSA
jgi:hypothetical protein